MHNRFNISYTTTDHGIIQRIGDAVQPVNAYRGIDDPVWVESVEMVDYGRYRVSGSKAFQPPLPRLLRARVPAMQPVGRGDDRGYSVAYLSPLSGIIPLR